MFRIFFLLKLKNDFIIYVVHWVFCHDDLNIVCILVPNKMA